MIFCQRRSRKTYPSSDSGNPSCCRLCGLVQLGTLHIVKIPSRRQKNNCRPPPRLTVYGRSLSHLLIPRNGSKPRLLWSTMVRIFRAFVAESRSHFERRETVQRFTEMSLGRRRAGLNRARSDRKPTRHDLLFAVVADKVDLYSTERRLEKGKCGFIESYLINKSI